MPERRLIYQERPRQRPHQQAKKSDELLISRTTCKTSSSEKRRELETRGHIAQTTTTPEGFVIYEIKKGDTLWSLEQKYGVSRKYLSEINHPKPIKMLIGEKIKAPAPHIYEIARHYHHTKKWITVTAKKGFYIRLIRNVEYNTYLKKEVQLNEQEIQEIVVDFNRIYNPELADLKDDTSNIPEHAKIWIPNVKFFLDYYRGAPIIKKPPAPKTKPPKLPPPPPKRPKPTEELIQRLEKLDLKTTGQYVKMENRKWVRNQKLMLEGAKSFEASKWENHPKWDAGHLGKRTVFGGRRKLKEARFIILHSTDSISSNDTVRNRKAHFAVEKNGEIRYLIHVKKGQVAKKHQVAPHAGISAWNKTFDLNQYSIGIEVVAKYPNDWTKKQYEAVKKLVTWLGGYFNLRKRDVLLHKQISYSRRWGRGSKPDPYGNHSKIFERLGLPDGSKLFDLDVAKKNVKPNIRVIENGQYKHNHKAWDGLKAAAYYSRINLATR